MRTTENDTTWTQQYMKKIIILSFLFVQGCGITVRKKKKGGEAQSSPTHTPYTLGTTAAVRWWWWR